MAITLAQANLYTVANLQKGIIETIIEAGREVIDRLPFETALGTSFDYDRESTLPGVDFYSPNETITESSGTVARVSTTLKKMVGDSDLDKFLRATKSDKMSIESDYVRMATKALTRLFLQKFIYGSTTTNAKEFDGLHSLVSTSSPTMTVASASDANGAALSLAKLDQLVDLIKPGKPDALIMSKRTRRRLSGALRINTVAGYITFDKDEFGSRLMFYDNIPIIVSDYVLDTESTTAAGAYSDGTSDDQSSVFAVKFGAVTEGGLAGIQSSQIAELERIDPVQDKDAIRFRVKWYVALALGNLYSLARYHGVLDGAVTA